MTFYSSSVSKILIIVLDLHNAPNVPETTSPSSSILAPAGENFKMQLSRVKNLQRRKELVHDQQVSVHRLDHRPDKFQQQSHRIVLLPLWCHVDIPVPSQLLVAKFSCKHDVLQQLM